MQIALPLLHPHRLWPGPEPQTGQVPRIHCLKARQRNRGWGEFNMVARQTAGELGNPGISKALTLSNCFRVGLQGQLMGEDGQCMDLSHQVHTSYPHHH